MAGVVGKTIARVCWVWMVSLIFNPGLSAVVQAVGESMSLSPISGGMAVVERRGLWRAATPGTGVFRWLSV